MSEVKLPEKMLGMKLPGGAKVEAVEVEVPKPGPGQVLLKMKAASLCGSDLKYIYYEHTDKTGGARYDDVIAGHEPSGQVVAVGEDVSDFKVGETEWSYIIFRAVVTVTSAGKDFLSTVRIRRDVRMAGREMAHWENTW